MSNEFLTHCIFCIPVTISFKYFRNLKISLCSSLISLCSISFVYNKLAKILRMKLLSSIYIYIFCGIMFHVMS